MNSMANQDVLIGIVTLNRRKKLIKTLEECRKQGFNQIVIVNNGSTDGTREFLQKRVDVDRIFTTNNEGGSGGFNRIMHYFLETKHCDWLLLFDDDAYPSFSLFALRSFLSKRSDSSCPAYAFKVTYPDGALCSMNRPGFNVLVVNPLQALLHDHHIQESTNSCLVDFASFVGILLKRNTVKKNGCVSKEFFIYSDDTYYTLSISSQFGKICYCPEFVFIHDCNRSSQNLVHHDSVRLTRDVTNKIVLIREYSNFRALYIFLYVTRLVFRNPQRLCEILRATYHGLIVDLKLYKND